MAEENKENGQTRIERVLEEGEEESDVSFSHEQIEQEWERASEKTKSQWVMGIYGAEGTAKSGALLDLRTPEEIDNGTKIVVIDVDNSCRPLWEDIWNYDPGIRIFNPLVKIGEGTDKRPSYIASYRKTIAILSWIEENIEGENIGYVAIDGFDTFLKWCEYIMKDVEYGDIDVHNSNVGYDWGKRNRRYYRVLDWLKSLPVPTIITAHRDKQKNFDEGTIKDRGPNWHKGAKQNTADELFQIIEMKKRVRQRGAYEVATYIGEIHKWKGSVELEQKKIKVLESKTDPTGDDSDDDYTWYGLIPKIRKHLEKIEQKEKKPPSGHFVDEDEKEIDRDEESISSDELLNDAMAEEESGDLTDDEEELLSGLNEDEQKVETAETSNEQEGDDDDETKEIVEEEDVVGEIDEQTDSDEEKTDDDDEKDDEKEKEEEDDDDWFDGF